MLRNFCLFLAALSAAALNAESPAPLSLDVSGAVQRALYGNRDLRAARWSIEQARGRTVDAGSLENPTLNLTGSSDFAFSDEGESGWSVGLEQKFPVTDRLQRLENLASLEVQLAQLEVSNVERELAFEVERVMDAIAFIDADLALYQEQIDLNQRFAVFLQKKIERAESSPLDLGQANVSLAALNQKVRQLERERTAQIIRLRELLGLEVRHPIEIISAPKIDIGSAALPKYQSDQLVTHPAYGLRQQLVAIAMEETELARAGRWGDIAVEIFFEEGLANNAFEEPFTGNIRVGSERERFLGIGLSIPLPLHDRNRGEIISRRARVRQLEAELDALGFRLLNEAAGIEVEYTFAQSQIASYEEVVLVQARENLSQLEQAYSIGQVDLTSVFRAQERLLELRVDFAELNAALQRLATRWRYVTANNLPPTLTSEDYEK